MKGSYELGGGEFVTYPNRKFSKLIVRFRYEIFPGGDQIVGLGYCIN